MTPRIRRSCWMLSAGVALAACGGGGGGAGPGSGTSASPPAQAPATTFSNIAIPNGFQPGTASVKSVRIRAEQLTASGNLPAGSEDPRVNTWVTFGYVEAGGITRTLGILRWTTLMAIGAQGVLFELPANVTRVDYEIYNPYGRKTGSLSV